jgi:hypothetical protein
MVEALTEGALMGALMGVVMGALMGPLYTGACMDDAGDDDASCSASAHHCLP